MKPLTSEWVEKAEKDWDYAVEFRYPGASADLKIAKVAQKICKSFRATARQSLGLEA